MTEIKKYKDLIESWNISAIINDMKDPLEANVMNDLYQISASFLTTIESQKEEISDLKATIGNIHYCLTRLDPLLEMPERGYVRNTFNNLLSLTQEGDK